MRIKAKTWAVALLFAALLLIVSAVCLMRVAVLAEQVDKSGWSTKKGAVCYLNVRGKPVQGWQEIDGNRYYFVPPEGRMATGWQNIGADRYCFAENGIRLTGWQSLDGLTYYFGKTGKMVTGLQTIEGKRYYFREDGSMATGSQTVDGGRYYFSENGAALVGWQSLDGANYYFAESGAALTGWHTLEGKRYCFSQEGSPLSGWQTVEGKLYYFTENGQTLSGWQTVDGVRCRFDADGTPLSGWFTDKTGKYFFGEKGRPLVGWQELENRRYYFGLNGIMTTGWLSLGGDRYYFHPDGVMAVGEVVIDGVSNFFTSKGKYVLLVNHKIPVPQDYVLDLVKTGNYQIDRNAKGSLEAMIQACRQAGYSCTINNTYRSKSLQEYLWNRTINQHMTNGMSYADAVAETAKDTMKPGHSEHQTGLAVDLDGSKACYAWLEEHCWEYGFILRYPDGKTDMTGIIHEPWHFRYVGTELSLELRDNGLCMEEYMQKLTEAANTNRKT